MRDLDTIRRDDIAGKVTSTLMTDRRAEPWELEANYIETEHKATVVTLKCKDSGQYSIIRLQGYIENLAPIDLGALRASLANLVDGHNEILVANGFWKGAVSPCSIISIDIKANEKGAFRRAQAVRKLLEIAAQDCGEKFSYVTIEGKAIAYCNRVNPDD